MKKVVILTGAGISAESGIKTFRDQDGLWEEHRIEDVATYNAWLRNPELVLGFYNQRRKQLFEVEPNEGHKALVKLEVGFKVNIITQNVDDLHERAGSASVLHLHGELKKVRSTLDDSLVYTLEGWELKKGDFCELGSQLRPHIVWFGEAVPLIADAAEITSAADIFIIIGTSLLVYPAAGLLYHTKPEAKIYLVDPEACLPAGITGVTIIKEKAGTGVPRLVDELLRNEVKAG